jgi:hypothetical protein
MKAIGFGGPRVLNDSASAAATTCKFVAALVVVREKHRDGTWLESPSNGVPGLVWVTTYLALDLSIVPLLLPVSEIQLEIQLPR